MNLHPSIMEGLEDMRFLKPTPIQEQVIPLVNSGRDVIACAQTGTGKTAAYLIPVLHDILLSDRSSRTLHSLIVVPTRELAQQIDMQAQGFAYHTGVGIASIYGGGESADWDAQRKAVTSGAEIIIATPGRLLSHLNLGYLDTGTLKFLILDEADRMLDMGFIDDIMNIIKALPAGRRTLMFSATMPPGIRSLAMKIMNQPAEASVAVSKTAEGILEGAYVVFDNQKNTLIKELVAGRNLSSVLIFTATRKNARELAAALKKMSVVTGEIHSDLQQSEREEVMLKFRNRQLPVLVATDVLSRGIDVVGIDLVINYDVPSDPEDYIHRVGRTARAEATGIALTLITPQDNQKFLRIERFLGRNIRRLTLPASLGEGPDLTRQPDRRNSKDQKSSRRFRGSRKPGKRYKHGNDN